MVCEAAVQEGGGARFERILVSLGIEVVPVTVEQARLALEAFKPLAKDEALQRR